MNLLPTQRALGGSDGITPPTDQTSTVVPTGRNTKRVLDVLYMSSVLRVGGSGALNAQTGVPPTNTVTAFSAFDLTTIAANKVAYMFPTGTTPFYTLHTTDTSVAKGGNVNFFSGALKTLHVALPDGPMKLSNMLTKFGANSGVFACRYWVQRGLFTPQGSVYYKVVIARTSDRVGSWRGQTNKFLGGLYARPVISTVPCTPDVAVALAPPLGETWIIADSLSDFGFDYSIPISRKQEAVLRAIITDRDPSFPLVNMSFSPRSNAADILNWRQYYMRSTGMYAKKPATNRRSNKSAKRAFWDS